MRWTQLLSVDSQSLLRDNHQVLTVFIDLIRTYFTPIIVNLKCPSMYGRIDRLREHDIVVGGVVVRGGCCKCFGITPNRITCVNFEAVPAKAYLNLIVHDFALQVDVIGQWPLSP
jgi:hypothetical protein